MSITSQHRVTVRCDVCGKTETLEAIGQPLPYTVPVEWIQTAPPGMTSPKEFCSMGCLGKWKSDVKPWADNG